VVPSTYYYRVIKIGIVELTYDNLLTTILAIINLIKSTIVKTECKVHKFINIFAFKILRNDKYFDAYNILSCYIKEINDGVVWADQDFKSLSHFYNPVQKRGLYGRKSAMDLGVDYYNKAVFLWKHGEYSKSCFYLGACLHIIQDMVIPQHANIRLLDNHRQFETYVKRTYEHIDEFHIDKGAYRLKSIEHYIKFNARVALKIDKKFKYISDDETRFYRITRCIIPLAERTTAGAMVMFFNDIMESGMDFSLKNA